MKKIYSTPAIEVMEMELELETMISTSPTGTEVYSDSNAKSTRETLSNERRGIFGDDNRATLDSSLW